MSVKQNIQLMQRWFQEVWNEGRTQTVYDLMSPNAVGRGQTGPQGAEVHGPAEFVPFVERIRGAFPDIKLTIDDIFGAKDKVVVRWSATMTHSGEGLGLSPTGKAVRVTGTSMARILNGQIIEGWDNWDQLGMLQQVGAYKEPEAVILAKSA